MGKAVIIACDFADKATTLKFLDRFRERGVLPFVKIGMELFYAEGPQIVREIKARGHRIFLDLKLHDIPNTVKKAMAVLSALDVDMCNLHAAGTRKMMEAALEGLTRPDGTRPLLLGVTQLTSTDQRALEDEILIPQPIGSVVMQYAQNVKAAGLDGVVCSPLEATDVHRACGAGFLTVTPGVRFPESAVGDQKRVTTPAQAAALGSDYIVMGRPITGADDPVAAYLRATAEFCGDSITAAAAVTAAGNACAAGSRITPELIAADLLNIHAVFLRPNEPFTWASGIKSPIYCDNRLTLTAPEVRLHVERGLAQTVREQYPDAEVLMGTSTAGIAHAAITGHLLNMPMGYVRSGSKDHGRQNRIEGRLEPGQKVVVIEDLISTGGSAIEVVNALREAGAEVLGIASIFTYGMKSGLEQLAAAGVKNVSLTDFDTITEVAAKSGYISDSDRIRLLRFRDDPADESWITANQ
jgi:orotidine-5'-phosphate decarboxylase